MSVILCIPDTQFPFHHKDTFEFLKAVKKKYKPTQVVHMGDEVDFHCIGSRWPSNPDGLYSPAGELAAAVKCMHQLYEIFPVAKVCVSNHTIRPLKKAFESGIPKAFLRDYHEFLDAPEGWTWADSWIIDEIKFEHGEGVSGQYAATKAASQNMRSTVIGHIHSYAGIQYVACHDRLIFGFNTGCLIDRNKYAFAYGKAMRVKPILGCGVITDGVPHFIPMILNKSSRWTKKL